MKIVLFTGMLLLTACTLRATDHSGLQIVAEYGLGPELAETSGLYCPDDQNIYTINDSGNAPILFRLNIQGEIVEQRLIDSSNQDWESLTGDETNFYIGDIGNNKGKRKFVEIKVVSKKDMENKLAGNLNIYYANNTSDKNEYLNHDFDAEALVSINDGLLLFSKSWKSNSLHIYQLSKTETTQVIEPFISVDDLPGVVTGVDYNKQKNEFVLVGYSVRGLGSFTPFIAQMDAQYKLLRYFPLAGFNQVEGVCVSPNGEVWISQESSFFSTHKLAKVHLP
jgi:uncharacterized protein YjiK